MLVPVVLKRVLLALAATTALSAAASAQSLNAFTAGDLVISVYGAGAGDGTAYTDNQAAPITLQQYTTTGIFAGQLVLPQTTTTANGTTNYAISGEYGSSSEGTLQRSSNGQYLTIAGYGVNASDFNTNAASYGGAQKSCITSGASAASCYPLAQTVSVAGTPSSSGSGNAVVVPRVVALIGAGGKVDTTTALTGVFNGNNPRSVATVDGSTLYISGQGQKGDTTQGLFVASRGATTATAINTATDTRTVSIFNNQLFLSTDSTQKAGGGVTETIASYGTAGNLPTGATTPSILPNITSKFAVTSTSQLNTLDQANGSGITAGTKIYLSPENFFFANPSTLYVADSGAPKGDNNGKGGIAQGLSNGGLQKWTLSGGVWVLDYTLSLGLNLVPDTTTCGSNQIGCGTTGLIGLTGQVIGNTVQLFATNSTLGDLDPTYLFGITDLLAATDPSTANTESFTTLVTAAPGTNIRGVAFAPVPEPASLSVLTIALTTLGLLRRRRRHQP